MKKMTCYILDDEPPAIRILEKYLADLPFVEIQGASTDPFEALACLQTAPVDLLFLDINLPHLSGMDLLRTLPNPPQVIFTTAYPEYAVEGFELEATDYLVKPIARERFLKAVNRAFRLFAAVPAAGSPKSDHILIRADRKLHRASLGDILFLQAYGDYVKVVCAGQTLLPKEKLQQLHEKLPGDHFCQVHRSYIVNLNHIEYMEGNHLKIKGYTIPVSNRYKADLLQRMERKHN